MIDIDTKQVRQLERNLLQLSAKGVKYAQRNTINDQAFETQKDARGVIRSEFINRNQWTARSVQVERARVIGDNALAGSTEAYMADQEFGARGGPRHVPTPAAAGQSNRSAVRTQVVRKANRMNAIQLGTRNRTRGNPAARNIAAVAEAKAKGQRFVYLERGKVKGIYRVMGTKRKPKTRMVQNLSRRVRIVKPHPWLRPASLRAGKRGQQLYAVRLQQQLVRWRA